MRALFDDLARAQIENVLALRGDPPAGSTFETTAGGFAHADELIAMLRRNYDFCIGAACYPEKHPEAPTIDADLQALKRKADAGADFFVSQLFFDNARFFGFERRARGAGIAVRCCRA